MAKGKKTAFDLLKGGNIEEKAKEVMAKDAAATPEDVIRKLLDDDAVKKQMAEMVEEQVAEVKKEMKKQVEKALAASKEKSNPPGKDGKPRKMIRIQTDFHAMAKLVSTLDGVFIEDYVAELIHNDFKSRYPELYKNQFGHLEEGGGK
jgi:predicted HicB family RNase H-like nuclease